MNTKTIIKKTVVIFGLVIGAIFVTSCDNDNNEPVDKNPQITLSDFEKVGKVYQEGDPALKNSDIGKTPEMAMTPIVIKSNGFMYHRNDPELNKILAGDRSKMQTYYTDLQTFAKVTGDPYATLEYVSALGSTYVHDSTRPYPEEEKETKE